MRRIAMTAVASAMSLSLAGCGMLGASEKTGGATPTRSNAITVGVLMPEETNTRYAEFDYPIIKKKVEAISRYMETRGKNNADLIRPASVLCLQCHGPKSPNGPHTATLEQHTHHRTGSTGSECINCHMPKIEPEIANVNVRSHTFKFIAPLEAERLKMPNSCNTCHTDKNVAWANDALKTWPEFSPWRVGN